MAANGIVDSSRDVVSVTIPAEYVQDFRAAVVSEIRWEAECIVKDAAKATPDEFAILKRLDEPEPADVAVSYADVRNDARLMGHDVALFDQLEDVQADSDAELHLEGLAAMESLAHVFEAMARNVVGPRLAEALGVGPIDAGWLPKINGQIERVSWAAERAAEYHTKCAELREAD
jgi:hypothetical protein